MSLQGMKQFHASHSVQRYRPKENFEIFLNLGSESAIWLPSQSHPEFPEFRRRITQKSN